MLMVLDKVIDKLYRNRKEKYPYDIEIDQGEFRLSINYSVEKSMFLQAAFAVQKRLKKRFKVLKMFELPSKLYGSLGKKVKQTIKEIEKEVKGDLPDIKFLSWEIKSGIFEQKGKKYFLTVKIEGVCMGE